MLDTRKGVIASLGNGLGAAGPIGQQTPTRSTTKAVTYSNKNWCINDHQGWSAANLCKKNGATSISTCEANGGHTHNNGNAKEHALFWSKVNKHWAIGVKMDVVADPSTTTGIEASVLSQAFFRPWYTPRNVSDTTLPS